MTKLAVILLGLAPALALADKPAPTRPVPAGAIDCAKAGKHVIDDGAGSAVFAGTCDQIVINGGMNHVTIENVKQLVINGAANTITVDGVDTISLVGNGNKLTYKKGIASAKPKVQNTGTQNTVTQGK